LWAIAQPLLLHNWFAGFALLAMFVPFSGLRIAREEQMLLRHFGEGYRDYMKQTGRIYPRSKHKPPSGGLVEREFGMKLARDNDRNQK